MSRRVIVEADGGSRGNPGNAGYGAVVLDAQTREVLAERAGALGITTNNVAEYSGLIAGLKAALDVGAREVDVRMDSKLVVEQMSGRWQVKHPSMKPLAAEAAGLVRRFDAVRFAWIPRLQNTLADKLANSAMDGVPVNRDFAARPELAAAPGPAAEPESAAPGWGPVATASTFVLVRHGASVLSPEKRFSGQVDVPLSPDGAEQARRVAERLRARGLTAVVSSPLRRARRTAEAIAGAAGLAVEVDDGLVETDFGQWEGLTFAEVSQRWPGELAAWLASPDAAPPGGETFAATSERVLAARSRILAKHGEAPIAVVSHVSPIKTLLRHALDAPPASLFRMQIDVGSVSEIDWYADGPATVRLMNDTGHLS